MTTIKTVADLKKEIQVYKSETGRLPGAVSLYESEIRVLYRSEAKQCDTEINVYENGLVFYRCGKHKTVFRLHKVPDFYFGQDFLEIAQEAEEISWEFSLMLFGEDRIWVNQEAKERWGTTLFCDLGDGSMSIEQSDPRNTNPEDSMIKSEFIDRICSLVTEKQAVVFRLIYEEELTQQEAADRLGMSRTAVANAISRVYATVKKHVEDVF